MDIQAFNIKVELIKFLESKNIYSYTKVQEIAIPKLLKHENVLVKAPTGSGKTFSFLLPIITRLKNNHVPQVIIFVPTRELGIQISDEIKAINKFLTQRVSSQLIIGGREKDEEINQFGKNQIIISTPTRLQKIQDEKNISLRSVETIIIDEIDMIYDFGFLEEIVTFKEKYLKNDNLSIAVFSATLNNEIKNVIKRTFNLTYKEITVEQDKKLASYVIKLNDRSRLSILSNLLQQSYMNPFLAIIFAKTNEDVESIFSYLLTHNHDLEIRKFNNNLTQRERKRLLSDLREQRVQYLVTTDLMARGMDFPGVTHIINYNMPSDNQYFLHRIGRTNRSNFTDGKVYTIVDGVDLTKLQKIASKEGINLEPLSIREI